MGRTVEYLLFGSYPIVFRAAGKLGRYPLPISRRGIECGLGWFPIVEDLAAWLENEARMIKAAGKQVPLISQVKEKMGTLTIYVRSFPKARFFSDLHPRLIAASDRSEVVCEICGAPGTFYQSGYWRVRCDKCELNSA